MEPNKSSPPYVIYQSVELDIDMFEETIYGNTILWIGFKTPIYPGTLINLHCRQLTINNVMVNNVVAKYTFNDPFNNLVGGTKPSYLGEEIDIIYRAALEVSRSGELQIEVPVGIASEGSTEIPNPLPKICPKDVKNRFEKLKKAYHELSASQSTNNTDQAKQNLDGMEATNAESTSFVQIKIKYVLSKIRFPMGYTSRTNSNFAEIFEKTIYRNSLKLRQKSNRLREVSQGASIIPAQCVYSTNLTEGNLQHDIDGIRCWLPCIDNLDQRLVFDISIKAIHDRKVVCCGKKISSVKFYDVQHRASTLDSNSAKGMKENSRLMRVTRFVTPIRIPSMSVGFFVGQVEGYKMPLYKVNGRLWVVTGLNDFRGSDCIEENVEFKDMNQFELNKKRKLDSSIGIEEMNTIKYEELEVDKKLSKLDLDANQSRLQSNETSQSSVVDNTGGYMSIDQVTVNQSPDSFHGDLDILEGTASPPRIEVTSRDASYSALVNLNPNFQDWTKTSDDLDEDFFDQVSKPSFNSLYEHAVQHSTLGLDLALRYIHKFAGRRYDYEEFIFVYVHELGKDFIAYDGFAMIDAKFLHSIDQVYMETINHMILINAYLYSWFKSSFPIDCYSSEFLMHGMIGYLINCYAEEIYGEDDGKYLYQKKYDSVVELEKLGKSSPLYCFYPENYERNSVYFSEYLTNKSAVLLQLMDNQCGGKDAIRLAIKRLLKSPALYAKKIVPQKLGTSKAAVNETQRARSSSIVDSDGNRSPASLNPDMSPLHGQASPYSMGEELTSPTTPFTSGTPFTPYYGWGVGQGAMSVHSSEASPQLSPYFLDSVYGGYKSSPFHQSPGLVPADSSPYGMHGYQSAEMSPYHLAGSSVLQRQASITSGMDWEKDMNLLETECITPEFLVGMLRYSSGISADLSESFLDKYIYRTGVLTVRLHVSITPKVESKPRQIIATTEQIAYKANGTINNNFCTSEELRLRIAELRDGVVTEPNIMVSDTKQTMQQQAYSRPGRGGGRRKGPMKKPDEVEPTQSAERLEEITRQQKDIEERKSAFQIVRDREHPIRFAVLDPVRHFLCEVHSLSTDVMLVEQLYSDISEHNVYFHCQALRSLSRASVAANTVGLGVHASSSSVDFVSTSTAASAKGNEKSLPLQLRAFMDCIQGDIKSLPVDDHRYISSPHNVYIRAEAAFALANWQNNIAPNTSPPIDNDVPITELPWYSVHTFSYAASRVNKYGIWHGMYALLGILQELYIDLETSVPTPNDFTNESSTLLRNSLLLALSTIRSQSGITPPPVVQMLTWFAQFQIDPIELLNQLDREDNEEVASEMKSMDPEDSNEQLHAAQKSQQKMKTSDYRRKRKAAIMQYMLNQDIDVEKLQKRTDRTSKGTEETMKLSAALADDSHYRAVLFLALSRMRFDSFDKEKVNDPMHCITSLALKAITDAFTKARAIARINYVRNGVNRLPSLKNGGIEVAAAIGCLSEMDVQAMALYCKGRSKGFVVPDFATTSPTDSGLFSGFNYRKHFLYPTGKETTLKCTYQVPEASSSNVNINPTEKLLNQKLFGTNSLKKTKQIHSLKDEIIFYICGPWVRAAALEGFIRICLSHQIALDGRIKMERHRLQKVSQYQNETVAGSEKMTNEVKSEGKVYTFIGAIVEAINILMKTEPSSWIRQQSSILFLEAIQHRPARMAAVAVSLSNPWYCLGWSDINGLTQTYRTASMYDIKQYHYELRDAFISSQGKYMKIALRIFWGWFTSANFSQTIRNNFLTAWLYIFKKKMPRLLVHHDQTSEKSNMIIKELKESFFDGSYPMSIGNRTKSILSDDRLPFHNPTETFNNIEMCIKYGLDYFYKHQEQLQYQSKDLNQRNVAEKKVLMEKKERTELNLKFPGKISFTSSSSSKN